MHYLTQVLPLVADIFNNLHGAVGKTAITKILQALVDREDITTKAYGKQSVFVVRQDNLPAPSSEELEEFDAKLARAKEELQAERERTRTLQSTLSGLQNSLTSEEMAARLAHLGKENEHMYRKLEELRSGGRKVDPMEKASVDAQYEKLNKLVKTRKKLCMEIVGTLSESTGKKPKVFMEDLGLELDPQ